jgi:hypothetical protein
MYTLIPETISASPTEFDLLLKERSMYGSSRLGVENIGEVIASTTPAHINIDTDPTQIIGDKMYELSNQSETTTVSKPAPTYGKPIEVGRTKVDETETIIHYEQLGSDGSVKKSESKVYTF